MILGYKVCNPHLCQKYENIECLVPMGPGGLNLFARIDQRSRNQPENGMFSQFKLIPLFIIKTLSKGGSPTAVNTISRGHIP